MYWLVTREEFYADDSLLDCQGFSAHDHRYSEFKLELFIYFIFHDCITRNWRGYLSAPLGE